jgi:hypothetical protein
MFAVADPSLIDRLEEMPPGAELGALLALLDRDRLDGYGRVMLLMARARQIAWLQAEFYADVWAVAEAERTITGEGCYDYTSEELQAALTCTRRAADRHLGLASQLDRLPQVREALANGLIDLPKAKVICHRLSTLDDESADRLATVALERAPTQTTGQLAARIDRLIIALDPEAAHQRYQRSVSDRHVTVEPDSEGTATLTGWSLPTDQALRAMDFINQLAHRLRVKGETRTMDQLRADIMLDLLQGNHLPAENSGRGVVDLRIDLTTLAGLDDLPAQAEGWGPLMADVARQVVHDQPQAEWRVTVTSPEDGQPVSVGTTRRRPAVAQRRQVVAHNPTCVFPGCRTPATRSDLDHNLPWAKGGPTVNQNLAPLCPRHHTAKDRGGWILRQIRRATHLWISPLGHQYLVKPEPP